MNVFKLKRGFHIFIIGCVYFFTFHTVFFSSVAGIGLIFEQYSFSDLYTELVLVGVVMVGMCCVSTVVSIKVLDVLDGVFGWSKERLRWDGDK